jgi:hypothetical protein
MCKKSLYGVNSGFERDLLIWAEYITILERKTNTLEKFAKNKKNSPTRHCSQEIDKIATM